MHSFLLFTAITMTGWQNKNIDYHHLTHTSLAWWHSVHFKTWVQSLISICQNESHSSWCMLVDIDGETLDTWTPENVAQNRSNHVWDMYQLISCIRWFWVGVECCYGYAMKVGLSLLNIINCTMATRCWNAFSGSNIYQPILIWALLTVKAYCLPLLSPYQLSSSMPV